MTMGPAHGNPCAGPDFAPGPHGYGPPKMAALLLSAEI
jgi:hypothetical protein